MYKIKLYIKVLCIIIQDRKYVKYNENVKFVAQQWPASKHWKKYNKNLTLDLYSAIEKSLSTLSFF